MNCFKLTAEEMRSAIAQFLIDENKMIQAEGNMDVIHNPDGSADILIYSRLPN